MFRDLPEKVVWNGRVGRHFSPTQHLYNFQLQVYAKVIEKTQHMHIAKALSNQPPTPFHTNLSRIALIR